MKFYMFLIFNNNLYASAQDKLIEEVRVEEFDDKPKEQKELKLNYRHLNLMFFLFGIMLSIFYFCNEFLVDTLDIIDSIFFSVVLILNLVINWMTKPRSNEKICSKKRTITLLINFIYLCGLLTGYTLGYILNKIEDCNLFTGAKDCHSSYTFCQYICSFLMFFILMLKLCF